MLFLMFKNLLEKFTIKRTILNGASLNKCVKKHVRLGARALQ